MIVVSTKGFQIEESPILLSCGSWVKNSEQRTVDSSWIMDRYSRLFFILNGCFFDVDKIDVYSLLGDVGMEFGG